MPVAPTGIGPRGETQHHGPRKQERRLRRMQLARWKPQRVAQPKPRALERRETRYAKKRS